ncbi:MAG: hypothetical protein J0L73_14125 [Verrucomicrobia bacterium]|nr:hypothetical protein [Verrucomicrobiota bacterium]
MKRIRHTIHWLFTAPGKPITPRSIIGWWERRRIAFNAILGIIGFIALLLFTTSIENAGVLQPGEDAVEPVAIVVVPLIANAAYTGGWLLDCPLRIIRPQLSPRFTPRLFRLGLLFSVFVVTFPALLWGGYRLLQLLHLLR